MNIDRIKVISFFYWARSVAFAMQALFMFILILISSIQQEHPFLRAMISHPLFGWIIFFLVVAIVSSVTIEHLEKR